MCMDLPITANRVHLEGIQQSLSTQGADSNAHTRAKQLYVIPPKSALSTSGYHLFQKAMIFFFLL